MRRTLRLARAGARGRRARHARRLAHVDHRARAAAGCRRRHADARRPAGRAHAARTRRHQCGRRAVPRTAGRRRQTSPRLRQTAIVGTVTVSAPRPNVAWERFTRRPARAAAARRAAKPSTRSSGAARPASGAARRAARCVPARAWPRIRRTHGRLRRDRGPRIVPARPDRRADIVNGRVAIVGNAAQTLHPVAGQGPTSGCAMRASSIHCPPKASRPPHSPPSTRAAHSTGASRSARPTRWRACSRSTQPAPAAARRGAHRAGVRTAAQEGDRATDDVRPAQLTRGAGRAAQTGSNRRGMGIR